jgi:hypothetical protein
VVKTGRLSRTSIDICELVGDKPVSGAKAGTEAVNDTVVIGTVSGNSCPAATSISRSIWL